MECVMGADYTGAGALSSGRSAPGVLPSLGGRAIVGPPVSRAPRGGQYHLRRLLYG